MNKCDPLFVKVCPELSYHSRDTYVFNRPNLHNSTNIEISLKKVRHEKCDPLFWEDWYGPVGRPYLYNLVLTEIWLKKV